VIASSRCALCHGFAQRELCDGCERSLPWVRKPCRGCALPLASDDVELCADCLRAECLFDGAWAAFRLTEPVQGLIHELKYSAQFAAARMLGRLAAGRLAKRPQPMPELVIPVPLHPGRLRVRGYNQALQLALAVQSVLAIRVEADVVRRVRATSDQIGQALLDDVMTTGATLAELARACRQAGAARVEVWAIARAL
jgi:predicted amidophosphoribosyltransferase